jgi:hypothetical protein
MLGRKDWSAQNCGGAAAAAADDDDDKQINAFLQCNISGVFAQLLFLGVKFTNPHTFTEKRKVSNHIL